MSSRLSFLLKKLEVLSSGQQIEDGNLKTWADYSNVYWELTDCLEATKPIMKNLIIINLLCSIPKLLNWMYINLVFVKDSVEVYRIIFRFLEGFQIAFMACLPGVIAETIKSNMDRIKLVLVCQLYSTKDLREKRDIENFLKFLKLRPLDLCVWGVVPVDMRLPVGLISLLTTYLIVIVQLYHLFD